MSPLTDPHSLMMHELKSISENREEGFIYCNDRLHKIPSKWENGLLKSSLPFSFITERCGNDKPYFIHTHILHTSLPSESDFAGYDKNIFKGFCVAGIDGFRCYNNEGNIIVKKQWNREEFSKKFKSIGGKIWKGKNGIFCDRIGKDYYCEINNGNGQLPMGIFREVTMDRGKTSLNSPDADLVYQSENNGKIWCYSANGELSCIPERD